MTNHAELLSPKLKGRPRNVSFDTYASPVQRPNSDPFSFVTPIKAQRKFSDYDDISTAAPSPWTGASESPFGSPSLIQGSMRGTFHMSTIDSPFLDFSHEPSLDSNVSFSLEGLTPTNDEDNASAILSAAMAVDSTPPSTPRQVARCADPTTPPPAPKMATVPPLMLALVANSAEGVREALVNDSDAASFPFWDHKVEPPLCFALKRKCSAEIIRLLIENGADPEMKDMQGRGPSEILRSIRTAKYDPVLYTDIDAIEQILGVGPASLLDAFMKRSDYEDGAKPDSVFWLPNPMEQFAALTPHEYMWMSSPPKFYAAL